MASHPGAHSSLAAARARYSAFVITSRWWQAYDMPAGRARWTPFQLSTHFGKNRRRVSGGAGSARPSAMTSTSATGDGDSGGLDLNARAPGVLLHPMAHVFDHPGVDVLP